MKISRLCLTLLALGLLPTACSAAHHHAVTEETVISFMPMENLAAAQAALDFPLLVPDPADLPTGLALQSVYVIPGGEQGSTTLEYGAGEQTLTLHISTVPADAQGFEWRSDLDGPYESVIVRGTEGYWAPRIGELSWIEDGRLYHLQGAFSRADLLRITEGLHPFEAPTLPTMTATPTRIPRPTHTPGPTRTPWPTRTPTPSPTPFVLTAPDPADLDVARFIFDRHTPPLGTLTQQFRQELAAGQYEDFARQDVDLDGWSDILLSGSVHDLYLYVAILGRAGDA